MKKIIKLIFLLIAISLVLLCHSYSVIAQGLSVDWPEIPGFTKPTSPNIPLTEFFKYLYGLAIYLSAFITFIMAVWGGLKYIMAGPNPSKLKDAREQISFALLGLLIVLGSWLIGQTINPDLTHLKLSLPVSFFQDTSPDAPLDASINKELIYHETPVGTLITSEYLASSFLKAHDPNATGSRADIDYATSTWPPEEALEGQYSTDFQGALYGARLKRIHEVASTAVPVAKKLFKSTEEMEELLEECYCWSNCWPKSVVCSGQCECDSNSYPCDQNTRDELEIDIEEIKHLKNAFRAFLNANSLVEDYYNDNKSDIDDLDDQEIIDLIELMIQVENKGSYTPETDPPERDVGRNLWQMVSFLDVLKKVKVRLNPLENDPVSGKSHLVYATFAETTYLEEELNAKATIISARMAFLTGLEDVNVKEDPATFYSSAAFVLPETEPINPMLEPNYDFLNFIEPETAFAAFPMPPPGMPAIDFEQPPVHLGGTCDHITEIPIGNALDESIKLTHGIRDELFEIFLNGHLTALKADIWQKIAEEIQDMDCKEACTAPPCVPLPTIPPVSVCIPPMCLPGKLFLLKVAGYATNLLIDNPTDRIELAFERLDSEEPIGTDWCCNNEEGNCRDSNRKIDIAKLDETEYTLKEKLAKIQKLLNMSRELVGQQEYDIELRREPKYDLLLRELIDLRFATTTELQYVLYEDRLDLNNCHTFYEALGDVEEKKANKELMNCWSSQISDAIDVQDNEECSPDPYLDCNFFLEKEKRKRKPLSCLCYDENTDLSFYNKDRFPELYATTLYLNEPDLSSGIDLDQDSLLSIVSTLLSSKIVVGNFIGFGNNFYCCVSEYEE